MSMNAQNNLNPSLTLHKKQAQQDYVWYGLATV